VAQHRWWLRDLFFIDPGLMPRADLRAGAQHASWCTTHATQTEVAAAALPRSRREAAHDLRCQRRQPREAFAVKFIRSRQRWGSAATAVAAHWPASYLVAGSGH